MNRDRLTMIERARNYAKATRRNAYVIQQEDKQTREVNYYIADDSTLATWQEKSDSIVTCTVEPSFA